MSSLAPDLNDKYTRLTGSAYLTGIQALVRLPMDQIRRDRAAGLNTGVFISGYEGSPLGGYDLTLNRVRGLLAEHRIHFVPGVNEDLAATAVLGSQIAEAAGTRNVDGIIGIWYGKGPGVDRSGDVLRHANLAGTGTNSAALVLAGDDHGAKSSTIPHQSDWSLYNFGIPFFYPGNTQETLDYGLLAIALSRFSGAWAGMKMVTNVCDGGGTVNLDAARLKIVSPEGYQKKSDPRLIPPFTMMLEMEVNRHRLRAAEEFARVNKVNRWFGAAAGAKLGIVTAGKAYYDLMQALEDAGIGAAELEARGIRMAKYAMIFPLERHFTEEFAAGLSQILVLEEKRSFLEMQIRDALYNAPSRPAIIGKEDARGEMLLPPVGELDPDAIARVLRAIGAIPEVAVGGASGVVAASTAPALPGIVTPMRRPNYCSGCPHNRSTLLLEGQIAGGGIGCHGMGIGLVDANRGYRFITQMGGEGAPWIGMSPFVDRAHMFQNIGDGTFAHSGQLAVNAAIAAGVNVTYKILYNQAVAMTGGQQAAGSLPIPQLTRKLEAEGVKKIVVLAEDAHLYDGVRVAENAEVRDRNDLEVVLAEMEKIPGVTVIIYDQQCAAEKRRMRSRGKLAEPVKRLVIHEEVCEGCGDCVKQSNCMSLHPVETELGQKMRIHQSSCNKDYSCALGDCPSFVTVNLKPGTGLRKRKAADLPAITVAAPRQQVRAGDAYRILMPGIGGTGVVTINALLATAAALDGLNVLTLDQTGLAQKGGAVVSHLTLSERDAIQAAAKISSHKADLILGFDLLGAAAPDNLKTFRKDHTVAVVNTAETPTGDSIRARTQLPGARLVDVIDAATHHGHNVFLDASRLAENLFSSHMTANLFLLGAAWQAGLVPVSAASLEEAIRLNGVDAERNLRVLLWGRKYYDDAAFVEALVAGPVVEVKAIDRGAMLEAYQDRKYAGDYRAFLASVQTRAPELTDAVARYLYKLMANKDEYEVARLLVDPEFERKLGEQWESIESIEYNLHPPLLRAWGRTKKLQLGEWFKLPLKMLAAMKGVRGTPLDIFGYSALRREERALVAWYKELVERAIPLRESDPQTAQELVALPDQIRGYESIRLASIAATKNKATEFLQRKPASPIPQAQS